MALEAEIINHLTKEIETQINNMMTFRTRANLTIYIGPFVILGSYVIATKGELGDVNPNAVAYVSMIALGVCFILLGTCSALIERQSWHQCNRWRELIAESQAATPPDMRTDSRFVYKEHLLKSYLVVYALLFIAFISVLILLFNI